MTGFEGGGAGEDAGAEPGRETGTEAGGRREESSPPSYEQARAELEEVVRRLETGGVTLEESLALWERGEALARVCESYLRGVRARLAVATTNGSADGPAGGD